MIHLQHLSSMLLKVDRLPESVCFCQRQRTLWINLRASRVIDLLQRSEVFACSMDQATSLT